MAKLVITIRLLKFRDGYSNDSEEPCARNCNRITASLLENSSLLSIFRLVEWYDSGLWFITWTISGNIATFKRQLRHFLIVVSLLVALFLFFYLLMLGWPGSQYVEH